MYCPQCGTPNSPDRVFCVRCNAPLTPAANNDATLPPWLQQLDQSGDSASPQSPQSGDTPDWLRDAPAPPSQSQASAPSDLPPWLQGLDQPDTAQPSPQSPQQSTPTDLPDWLRELQASTPPPETPPPPSQPEPALGDSEPLPAWLADLQQSSAPAAQAQPTAADDAGDDVPPWLRDEAPATPPPAAAQAPAPSTMDDDVPDWLRDLQPTDQAAPPPAAQAQPAADDAGDDVPPWLRDEAPATPPPTQPAASSGMDEDGPEWLRELETTDQSTPPPAAHSAEAENEQPTEDHGEQGTHLPDWVRALEPEQNNVSAPKNDKLGFESPDITKPATGDLPTWLQDLDSEPPIVEISDEDLHPVTQTPTEMPSWMQNAESSEAAQAEAADAQPDQATDIPEWLRMAESSEPIVPAATLDSTTVPAWGPNESPIAETPPWMQDAQTDAPSAAETPVSGIPAWLQDTETPDAQGTPTVALEQDNVPPWLQDTETVAEDTSTVALEQDDVPPWLQATETPDAQGTPTVALEQDDVPPWLQDTETAEVEQSAESSTGPAHQEQQTVPEWLRDVDGTLASTSDIPAWLQAEEDTPEAPLTGVGDVEQAASDAESAAPSWLSEDLPTAPATTVRLDEPSSQPTAPSWLLDDDSTAAVDDSLLSNVDLPAWLRQSVKEPEQPSPSAEAETETSETPDWLRVLGPEETTPTAEVATEQPTRRSDVPLPPTFEPSPERLAAANLLREIIMQPLPEPAAEEAAVSKRWWQKVGIDRIIALLLLLAILTPFVVQDLPLTGPNRLGGDVAGLYTYINDLNSDSRVLIAYEADLRRSAELEPLTNVVMQHLQAQHAPMLLMSTDVQGTLVADREALQLRQAGLTPGADFINLAYFAGGSTALANLAQHTRDVLRDRIKQLNSANDINFIGFFSKVTGQGSSIRFERPIISSMQDFDLLVIVADSPDDVRQWVEQVWAVDRTLPVAVLTTNESAPLNLPYIHIEGAAMYQINGLAGMQAYANQLGLAANSNASENAISLGGLMIVVIVLGGGIAGVRSRAQRRRQKEND